MIKAVIFDLDNTLLDFVKMKKEAVMSAISSMKEAGLDLDVDVSYQEIMDIYETDGWENQVVFDKFLKNKIRHVENKYLAAGIVAYRRAKEANLKAYQKRISLITQNIFLEEAGIYTYMSQFCNMNDT